VGAENQQRLQEGVAAPVSQAQSGDAGAGGGRDRVGDGMEGVDSGDRVVAGSLDVQQTSVGGVADLPRSGQLFSDRWGSRSKPLREWLEAGGLVFENLPQQGDGPQIRRREPPRAAPLS